MKLRQLFHGAKNIFPVSCVTLPAVKPCPHIIARLIRIGKQRCPFLGADKLFRHASMLL